MKQGVALALAAGVMALEVPAAAVERENAIGVDVGGAMLTVADKSKPDVGASVGFHYTYGLIDVPPSSLASFNIVADAGWSLVALNETVTDPTTPRTRPTNVTNIDAGVAYVLDVLQWVAWGSLELGGYALEGGTIEGVRVLPGVALAVGVDYHLNRSWSVGFELREHVLFTEQLGISVGNSTYPSFTQALLRGEYVWGW